MKDDKLLAQLVDIVESSRRGPALTKYDVARALLPFIRNLMKNASKPKRLRQVRWINL